MLRAMEEISPDRLGLVVGAFAAAIEGGQHPFVVTDLYGHCREANSARHLSDEDFSHEKRSYQLRSG